MSKNFARITTDVNLFLILKLLQIISWNAYSEYHFIGTLAYFPKANLSLTQLPPDIVRHSQFHQIQTDLNNQTFQEEKLLAKE